MGGSNMTNKNEEVIVQTKLAFDFLQKLYLEITYLIKELEGQLAQEDEEFIIGRPSGYGVTTRNSTGLETVNVNLWIYKKLSVFFVPKNSTQLSRGQTITRFGPDSKILYFRFILDDKELQEPVIFFGVLKNLVKKKKGWPEKIEQVMAHFEYNEHRVFSGGQNIEYEDGYLTFTGRLLSVNLYDIDSSQDISEKLITPALKLFRE
jgi:hypothetical protein